MAIRTEVVTMHICSDGQSFEERALAEEHEALVALRAVCESSTVGTLGADIYDALVMYPHVFLKALNDLASAKLKADAFRSEKGATQ